MALASTVYDVLEDIIVDAQIDAQFTNERDLAAMHIARMSELGITENSIVIYDRGYYSAEMFKLCVDSGCFCLMRLHNNMKICRLDGDDVTTTVKAPDGTEIECRVLKILLSSGETEHLITNIMDTDLDCDLFRELYFERWKIESKYYEMKEHWKIEEFSGRSALSVRQDFYITMLHINMASLIKREADEVIETMARPKNKHKYKADRADIIGGLSTRFIRWIFTGYDMSKIEEFILYAAGNRIMVKPGRSRPRKRPTRARKHYENRKTVC